MILGRAFKIIVILILVIPFAFQGALSETPPSHENFEDAEKDLEILMVLLEDSLELSEETLSYLVNMDYSQENISIASAKADELHQLLLGAEILLANMEGEAASYDDLVEFLTVFQNLDYNITALTQYYSSMQENLTIVEDYINNTVDSNITAEEAIQSLNSTEINIDLVKEKVDDIENITNEINQKGFSTTTMEELIIEAKELVESDENITKEVAKLFKIIPNFLSLYVNKTKLALGDELSVYGYFFREGSYNAGQNITIFIDDQILDEVFTNSTGRYEFKREIPLNHTLDVFEIHTSTIYNDSLYISNRINITVGKIPTILTLSTQYPAYSPNQFILFSGRLVDHLNVGLAGENITLYFNDSLGNAPYFNNITITNISIETEGYYSFELNTTEIPIGIYSARAGFESDNLHNGSVSGIVNVSINIPTILTVAIQETVVYEGDNITFFGQLIDEINYTSLSFMIIEIYIEEEKVGEVVTDNLGWYEYVFSTFRMAIGKYNIHSKFNPNDIGYREAVSNIVEVEIQESDEPKQIKEKSLLEKIYDNIFLIIILIFIFLFFAVLYVRKKRTVPSSVSQTRRPRRRLKRKSISKEALIEKLIKETEEVDGKLKVLSETKNFREAIIIGYHTLLGIMEKNKVIRVKPSHTHLDIQQKLTDEGFPSTETSSITKIFEKAMYSNRPIGSHTLDDFITGVRRMFTQARGTKG